jgi:Arc/MetJ-type ribon-helix-helix transcriptional regulator
MCNTSWYTGTVTQMIARVPEDLVDAVDKLVSNGTYESRSDVIREALTQLVDRHRRKEIGRRIVEGYERFPETEEELKWAEESTRQMIEEEPW